MKTDRYLPLLSSHPLFSFFPSVDLQILLDECTLESYKKNEYVVKEGELIDAIYFIASGLCEVRQLSTNSNNESHELPIAVLREGESIGLTSIGLYSASGNRTASVLTLSNTDVLKLPIKTLRQFLISHPQSNRIFSHELGMMTRLYFIKSAAPFSTISNEDIKIIADKIEDIRFSAGETIFEQGDLGDACYIITNGIVDISITSKQGHSKNLAELEMNSVFGETALLMSSPRNATATAKTEVTLLKINEALFNEINQQHVDAPKALMELQLKRARPIKLNEIDMFTRTNKDGSQITILRSSQGNYFELTEQGLFIWNLLDGETTLNEIVVQFFVKFGVLNVESIAKYIINLHKAGFVHLDLKKELISPDINIPKWVHILSKVRNVMEFKVAFGNADEWVTKTYNDMVWLFYTKFAFVLWALITIFGFASFIYHFEPAIDLLAESPNKWYLFLLSSFLTALTIPLHELAHAFTTKYYGRKVHCFGLGWLWFGPFAFCDTSDMWLSSRTARVMVDLAGLYLNVILAGIAGLCAFLTFPDHKSLTIVLELFALNSYLLVFANLDVAFELDGYYTLMDMLDKPNLRSSALNWSIKVFSSKQKNVIKSEPVNFSWKSIKLHYAEIAYWVALLFNIFILSTIIPFLVLTNLLEGLFGITNTLISVTLTLIAVALSSINVYKEVLTQAEKT